MRWQVAAVIGVILLDLVVIWRWYSAPAMVVSRAALATASSGGCREEMLVRVAGVDRFYLIDVTSGKRGPHVVIGTAVFVAGAMTTSSAAAIAAGQDLNLSGSRPSTPQPTLAKGYSSAVNSRDSWIGGPCMPLEDPLAATLRPDGSVDLSGGVDQLYVGSIRYSKGAFDLFRRASVRIAVNPQGRLAFEGLSGQVTGTVGAGATEVAVRFLPAVAKSVATLSPSARRNAYTTDYRRLVHDLPLMAPVPPRGATGI